MFVGASPVLVGQREAVPGRRDAGLFGGLARIRDFADHAAIDQRQPPPRHALAVEGRTGLQRMVHVIGDADVFAEELLAEPAGQKAALVPDGGGAEVDEHLADEVLHRRRFEDDGVAAGRKFARRSGSRGLLRGAARQRARVPIAPQSGALALAQPELSPAIAVIENCPSVS